MARYLSFRDGGKTDEQGIGSPFDGLFSGEVKSGFATTQSDVVGMSVKVAIGSAFIPSGNGYPYHVFTDTAQTVSIATADGSNPRLDLIVAYVDLTEVDDTDPNNPDAFKMVAVAGSPAGSPSEPNSGAIQTAIGASNPYIILARVSVAAGATTITNANLVDRRAMTKAVDGRIPTLRDVKVYLNSGSPHTWTKPAGLVGNGFIEVEVQAGGGGGGGAASSSAGETAFGTGGAGGGYSYKKIAAASLGATETVTVGAAGTAASAGNNTGGIGGASSFGSHATTTGGNGGVGGSSSSTVTGNGVGATAGTASNGDLNIDGKRSTTWIRTSAIRGLSGAGGDSKLGYGGIYWTIAGNPSNAGNPATGYGAGGGGGISGNGNGAGAGGAATPGIVIVKEYY